MTKTTTTPPTTATTITTTMTTTTTDLCSLDLVIHSSIHASMVKSSHSGPKLICKPNPPHQPISFSPGMRKAHTRDPGGPIRAQKQPKTPPRQAHFPYHGFR